LILDIPVEIGLQRAGERSTPDRFELERVEFFERVRNRYLQIAKDSPERCVIIDASLSIEGVQVQIETALNNFLENG
jgi:dTMP kinase